MMRQLLMLLFFASITLAWRDGGDDDDHNKHCHFSTAVTVTKTVYITTSAPCSASSSSSSSAPPAPTPFTVIAAHSGSPIHLQPVEASGLQFWIGKGPTTFCPVPPVPADQCPAGTSTVFLVSGGTCSLVYPPAYLNLISGRRSPRRSTSLRPNFWRPWVYSGALCIHPAGRSHRHILTHCRIGIRHLRLQWPGCKRFRGVSIFGRRSAVSGVCECGGGQFRKLHWFRRTYERLYKRFWCVAIYVKCQLEHSLGT